MTINQLLARIRDGLCTLCSRLRDDPPLNPSVRRYIEFNQKVWGPPAVSTNGGVLLIGLFGWRPCLPGYAYLANHLARKVGASIKWYYFNQRCDRTTEKLFASFGAQPGLSFDSARVDDDRARKLAGEIFAGLETKWDVVNIALDGLRIGDLIYDTYLRVGPRATVDLHDPKLAELIYTAVRITLACQEYFSRTKVVGIIPDHLVYIFSGIIARCALRAGVPVYQVVYGPNFYACSISCPAGSHQYPVRWPHSLYKKMFAQLPEAEKEPAREKGRRAIRRRLAGHADGVLMLVGAQYGVPVVQSAYAGESPDPVLVDTGRPRIVILLHDFCDAVHVYRDLLFPDLFEWIHFLLSRASDTPFDWYVKPHPNVARDGLLASVNGGVIEDLKKQYPRIRFLSPTASSKQIIKEGVQAMFTGYGTAGHEFAYMGVPVVNAGDNPHIAYGFNLHPRNLAEYADCIARAGHLEIDIRREEIEEYVYMNYFYFEEKLSADANPMPESFFATEEYREARSREETLDYFLQRPTPEDERELAEYFSRIPRISEPLPEGPPHPKKRPAVATFLSA